MTARQDQHLALSQAFHDLAVGGHRNPNELYSALAQAHGLLALIADAGGGSTLAGLADVNVPAPNNNDALTWNSATSKWVAQAGSAPVASVFGRTGAVVGVVGDYAAFYSALGHTHSFGSLTAIPTTIGGYGITDFNTLGDARWSLLAHTHAFGSLTGIPTTIGGYGITDFNTLGDARWSLLGHTHSFASLSGIPTTLAGFGIVDAAPLVHTHDAADIVSGVFQNARVSESSVRQYEGSFCISMDQIFSQDRRAAETRWEPIFDDHAATRR